MIKLSDTQRILLSTASQRTGGSLLPFPASVKPGGGVTKSLEALIARGLAEERETGKVAEVHRSDGDVRWGVFMTAAGAEAIGVGDDDGSGTNDRAVAAPPVVTVAPRGPTKAAAVTALLERPEGATLPELIEATGWLPHTTRAALTGIRKKGHVVERSKRADVTCYRIVR